MNWLLIAGCVWAALSIGAFTGRLAEGANDKLLTAVLTALLWPLGALVLLVAALARIAQELRLPHVSRHRWDGVLVGPARTRHIKVRWSFSFGSKGTWGLMLHRFGDVVPRNLSNTRHLDEALSSTRKGDEA